MIRTTLVAGICLLVAAAAMEAGARNAEEYRTLIEAATATRPGYQEESWAAVTELNEEISESGVNEVLYTTALEMYRASDSSWSVKSYCMYILAESGTDEAFAIIAPLAREGNWRALEVASIFGERSIPIFRETLYRYDGRHPEWALAVDALSLFAEQGTPILLDYLSGQVSGRRRPDRVEYLITALGFTGDARAVPVVLEFTDDAPVKVRRAAYQGLQVPRNNFNAPPHFNAYKMDDYATVKAMEEAARKGLQDADEVIQAECVRVLGEMAYVKEDFSFLDYLEQEALSNSAPIRQAAEFARASLRHVQEIRERERLGRASSSLTDCKPNWWHEWRAEQEAERSPRQKTTE